MGKELQDTIHELLYKRKSRMRHHFPLIFFKNNSHNPNNDIANDTTTIRLRQCTTGILLNAITTKICKI